MTDISSINQLQSDSFLVLKVVNRKTNDITEVIVYRNSYGGGDLEIGKTTSEHYEDYAELISFFLLRFRTNL